MLSKISWGNLTFAIPHANLVIEFAMLRLLWPLSIFIDMLSGIFRYSAEKMGEKLTRGQFYLV